MKKFFFFSFFLVSCHLIEKSSVNEKKKSQQPSSNLEMSWTQIKNQKDLPFEKRIEQIDQFIKENQDKQIALLAYFLKADLFLENNNNKRACLIYHKIVKSSFFYSPSWRAYRESAKCYFKMKKVSLAFENLQKFIKNSKVKKEDKRKALLLQWDLIKNKKNWKKEKLMIFSSLSELETHVFEKKKWLLKGIKLIDKMPFKEKLNYALKAHLFPEFSSYLNYKIGFYYFENKQFALAEKKLNKALSSLLFEPLKKKIRVTLTLIQKINKTNPTLIGVILPLSGKRKLLGEKILRALVLGFNIDKDSPFQLLVVDSKNHRDVVRTHIEDFFYKHHVTALIGGLSSEVAEVMAEKAEEFFIPTVLFSQDPGLTKNRSFVFQNAVNSKQLLTPLIQELREKLKIKKVAIMYPDDSYGKKYKDFFEESFQQTGGLITRKVEYKLDEVDFKEEVKEILHLTLRGRREEFEKLKKQILKENPSLSPRSKKLKPENVLSFKKDFSALFIPDSSKSLLKIQDYLKYFGLKDIYLVGLNLWNVNQIKPSKDFSIVFVNLEKQKNQSLFYREFIKNYNQVPGHFEQKAYNTTVFLKKALNIKDTSRLKLKNRLSQIKNFKGAYGTLSVSKDQVFQYPVQVYKISAKP
ncbi:MAG: penicillin-binding protein activator [Bdellovibrionales bacterium]|nr:penicillin-binding protein activator [Bdellovibrionales bacterium]